MVSQILVLMENSDHFAAVRACTEKAGYSLLLVDSFAKATEILSHTSVDLIISDVHLQNGGSVFDFLKWVKSQDSIKDIPFALFSLEPNKLAKYLSHGIIAAGRQMGAAKYISMEHFDSGLFVEEIVELLRKQ
ncbi:MAG: hypothetical protein K2X81_17545 [Candidatus Obscuribacterales bacterium]|nr:hypothetical protein [Candidatus Obscuribacterales bacterium]